MLNTVCKVFMWKKKIIWEMYREREYYIFSAASKACPTALAVS